jgi:hypothetical protein
MADKKLGIFEAMKQSADLTKPYSGAVWAVIGVSVLISFISVFGVVGQYYFCNSCCLLLGSSSI